MPNFEYRLLDLNKMSERELAAKGLTYEVFPYILKMIWLLDSKPHQVLGGVLKKAEKLPISVYDTFMRCTLLYLRSKYPGLVTKEVLVKTAVKVKAKKATAKLDPLKSLEDYVAQREFNMGIEQGVKKGIEQGVKKGLERAKKRALKRVVKKA